MPYNNTDMGQAFYRKYRSKTLDEVIGQNHITTVLNNSLKSGNLSHAYLFTGPRGVGKTSVARILAKEANGLKSSDAKFYSDIIEIDAASNRRIEEIRELRDKIAIAPSQLKYKVYIIDEVHMLTREAFNALLKTLEEPPAHAIFILATTDFHKVPDTITSRCMRLNFKAITAADLSASLAQIAKKESINIDDEAINLIAEQSDGSFRDSLSMLDQMSSSGNKIDSQIVELNLGIANKKSITRLITQIAASETAKIFDIIQEMIDAGATPDQINKQLSHALRASLTSQQAVVASSMAVELIENLNAMYSYQDQRIALELAILKVITPPATKQAIKAEAAEVETPEPASVADIMPEPLPGPSIPKVKAAAEYTDADKLWRDVLAQLKDRNNTLYGIARMAEPELDGDKLKLNFKFAFHHKQLAIEKNTNLLMSIINELKPGVELTILVGDRDQKPKPAKISSKMANDDVKTVSNIFGSAEVLES